MKKFVRVLAVVFLLVCLALPASVAYAETPVSVAVVAASSAEDGLGSPFQHHSFIDNGTNWVLYYSGGMILSTWSDDGTTWVAGDIIAYCNASTAETIGGQFDTWWDSGDDALHVIVVNTSLNNSDINYASFDVDSALHTLTIDGAWVVAVEGVANVSYRNPTICITNNESPFITYGYVNNSLSDVYVVTTNNSADDPWVPEVNFPMFNLSSTGNESMYGSVIPLWTSDNVSVQYAAYNGSEYKIEQTAIYWDGSEWIQGANYGIDTSDWYLPTAFEWNYNAVSIDTTINDNDVVIQCGQTNGTDFRTFVNRRGNESDAWASTYAQNFGAGGWAYEYIGAIGIRNNAYGIVYSGWDMEALSEDVWSNDYLPAGNGSWSGIASEYADTNIPLVSTMSDYMYDIDDTYNIGFLYGTTTDDNIMYGLYGPAAPAPTPVPSTVPASVTTMAWIVILVFGALICLILLAYGASESIKGHSTEFVKIGAIGLLTLIIAAMIVEALL